MEAASRSGAGVVLTGQMGNATVSWAGNGSALLALLQRYPAMALRLFLHAEPNPWLTLKRQVLKPLLKPGGRLFNASSASGPGRSIRHSIFRLASELDLDGRMRAAGHDPTFTFSPLEDLHLLFFQPHSGIGAGIGSEVAAKHSLFLWTQPPTSPWWSFFCVSPTTSFCRAGPKQLFDQASFPEPIARSGAEGAAKGTSGRRCRPSDSPGTAGVSGMPEFPGFFARGAEILDMPLLHRCLRILSPRSIPTPLQGQHDSASRSGRGALSSPSFS